MRNLTYILTCTLLLLIASTSTTYYKNGYWNFNKKFDCSQRCVDIKLLCDGTPHCRDGSDEENCSYCNQTEAFHCKNNRCIPIVLQCDGYDDCWDGSDEWKCSDRKILFNEHKHNAPVTIHRIDAPNQKIMNFSSEINLNETFSIPMISFRTDRPDQALDGRTVIFEHLKKVVFYIPGFMTNDLSDGVDMKNSLVNGTNDVDCVILVDWRLGSYHDNEWSEHTVKDYTFVVSENVPVVSYYLASFINEKIPNHVKVHLVGFSLGGQIAGLAARTLTIKTERTIERISAIDPAGPIFEYSLGFYQVDITHTLRKTDATFVDIIHGSPDLGMVKEAGDVDFYMYEIDCFTSMCLHQKAFGVYLASITNCSQITCPEQKRNGNKCRVDEATELSSLGYLANMYDGRGRHSILFFVYGLLEKKKFSTGTCSAMLNVNLPAKFRICHKPPSVTSDCRFKPYLSMCQEKCNIHTLARSTCVQEGNKVIWSGRKCLRPISCLNEDGNQVKFFVAYKLPNSFNYIYTFKTLDRDTIEWSIGSHPISSIKSALGQTLSPIYEQVEPITFIIWNDNAPLDSSQPIFGNINNIDPFANGLSKGAIAYTKKGGILLSHSVPRYPPNPSYVSHYEYPESGKKFAQMAVCITSEKHDSSDAVVNEIEGLLDLILHFKPQVYASNVLGHWPLTLRNKFEEVIHPDNQQLGVPFMGHKLYGKSSVTIHSFGRSDAAGFKDIFNILAEHYKTSIVAQTLLDQNKPLSSFCHSKFSIENVEQLKIWKFYGIEWIEWSRTNDHSNWIASKSNEKPVVCVGDLNRARYAMQRGGMFICFDDEEFFKMFSDRLTYQVDSCDAKKN